MYGNDNVGYANAAPPPPKTAPRMDMPIVHLEEMAKGLAEYTMRLNRLAERFLGSIPEAVDKDGGQVRQACVASRYEAVSDTYGGLLRRLGNVVDRLESL